MSNVSREHFLAWKRAHYRVVKIRGRASDYDCIICGVQAYDWALRRATPEMLGTRPYSDDVWDYDPKCRKCHVGQDDNYWSQNPTEHHEIVLRAGKIGGKIGGATNARRWAENPEEHREMAVRGGQASGPANGAMNAARWVENPEEHREMSARGGAVRAAQMAADPAEAFQLRSRAGKIGGAVSGPNAIRITLAQRWQCLSVLPDGSQCPMITNSGSLAVHQRATGHEGRERIA